MIYQQAISAPSADNTWIRARKLRKVYRKNLRDGVQEIVPLAALDLEIVRGDFVSLMGPSGSGKTTLLNLLAGIDSATSGELWIGDHDLAHMRRDALAAWRAKEVGIIFQSYNLVPVLTAFENVELPLLLSPLGRRERAERAMEALSIVGLADRAAHFPSQLSGGQEQRVAIARAIVAHPPLLLADEPTGDLDRESAELVLQLLDQLNEREKMTIVMVTHDPRAAARARMRLFLEKGELARREEAVS
ncbi:MAG: hypothetical protein RIR10_1572 [Planctomycetota bacterium]|jgi:putative ABC transport system ATP-binding protein